jgi:Xaa-Pro aminopeptidase
MEGNRGTMAVDWEQRIDMARLRRDRLRRAVDAVAAAGYDAVLLVSDPNLRYVTGVATSSVSGAGGFHYSLLTADGAITHWDSADHAMVQRRTCPWLADVRFAAPGIGIVPAALGGGRAAEALSQAMADEIAGALNDRGIHSGRLGLDLPQPSLAERIARRGYEVDTGAGAALARARDQDRGRGRVHPRLRGDLRSGLPGDEGAHRAGRPRQHRLRRGGGTNH